MKEAKTEDIPLNIVTFLRYFCRNNIRYWYVSVGSLPTAIVISSPPLSPSLSLSPLLLVLCLYRCSWWNVSIPTWLQGEKADHRRGSTETAQLHWKAKRLRFALSHFAFLLYTKRWIFFCCFGSDTPAQTSDCNCWCLSLCLWILYNLPQIPRNYRNLLFISRHFWD